MRIIHTCLRYPPATGGVETYVKQLVERTRNISAHRDVRVLTSAMRTHGPVTTLNPELLLDDPPYIQRLFTGTTPFVSYPKLQALPYYLKHHQPDIIHAHSFWYQPADTASRYAKKHHIPFVFNPFFYTNKIRHKPLWRLYAGTIGKKTFANADAVIVISPYEQKLIEKNNFPVKRFVLIPPGVTVNQSTPANENPFAARSISGRILLSIGRISAAKGYQDMILALPEIIKKHPDVMYVIIGDDFGVKKTLLKLAGAQGVDRHVKFIGHLTDREILAAYRHADVFVHPSFYEAFGIVIAEASAAGLAVVARNVAAIPYVAPHNQSSLLFNDKNQLTRALDGLLRNKALSTRLGKNGQAYVRQNFSWEKSIKKLVDLYQELVPTNQ